MEKGLRNIFIRLHNFFGGMNYCSTFAASNNNKDVRKDDEQCIAYYSRGGPSSH